MKFFVYMALTTQAVRLRYDEAEGPTKVDLGESDETVAFRQDPKWVNPLSLTDDGTDDDQILNMNFKPLDEGYTKVVMPHYDLDEDIVDSLESEGDAQKYVAKAKQHEKEEARRAKRQRVREEKMAAEKAKKKKKANSKQQDAAKQPKKDGASATPVSKKSEQKPAEAGAKDQKAAPAKKDAAKPSPKDKKQGG